MAKQRQFWKHHRFWTILGVAGGITLLVTATTFTAVACGQQSHSTNTTPPTNAHPTNSPVGNPPPTAITGTLAENTKVADTLAGAFKNIEYNQIFNPQINGGKAPLGATLNQFEFMGVSNQINPQQRVNQQILVNYFGYYIAAHLNSQLRHLIGGESIQQNLGLEFSMATYTPTYGTLVTPITWGTNSTNRGDSLFCITIQFNPQLASPMSPAQRQVVANDIATAFPVISVAKSPILATLTATATNFNTLAMMGNLDQVFNFVVSYIRTNAYLAPANTAMAQVIQAVAGESIPQNLSMGGYNDLSVLPANQAYYTSLIQAITFNPTAGTITFPVGWAGVLSTSKMTVTGFTPTTKATSSTTTTPHSSANSSSLGKGLTIAQDQYLQANVTKILGEAEISFPMVYLYTNETTGSQTSTQPTPKGGHSATVATPVKTPPSTNPQSPSPSKAGSQTTSPQKISPVTKPTPSATQPATGTNSGPKPEPNPPLPHTLVATATTFIDPYGPTGSAQRANQQALTDYFCSYLSNFGNSALTMLIENGGLNIYQLMAFNFKESTFTNGSDGIPAYGMAGNLNPSFRGTETNNTGEMIAQFAMANGKGGIQTSEGMITVVGLQTQNNEVLPNVHGDEISLGLKYLPKLLGTFDVPTTSALSQLSASWTNFGFSTTYDFLPNWTPVNPTVISNQLALTTFVITTLVEDLSNPLANKLSIVQTILRDLSVQEIYNSLFLATGVATYEPMKGTIIVNPGIAVRNLLATTTNGTPPKAGYYNPDQPRTSTNSPYTYYISKNPITISGFAIPTTAPTSKNFGQIEQASQFISIMTLILNSTLPANRPTMNKTLNDLADSATTFTNGTPHASVSQTANEQTLIHLVLTWYQNWQQGSIVPDIAFSGDDVDLATLLTKLAPKGMATNFSLNFRDAQYQFQMSSNWFTTSWCLAIQPEIFVAGAPVGSIYSLIIPGLGAPGTGGANSPAPANH